MRLRDEAEPERFFDALEVERERDVVELRFRDVDGDLPAAAAERLRPPLVVELLVVERFRAPAVVDLLVADRFRPLVVDLPVIERLRVLLVPVLLAVERRVPVARPPLRPPFLAGSLFPRPEPERLPPPSLALTVAHARRSDSFSLRPRFS